MLDLNLDFVKEDETTAFGDLEESGSWNSSVVNADESIWCYNFDILKVGDTNRSEIIELQESGRLVRAKSNELQEIRLVQVQQQQQKVNVGKKSRRGPRSRSSQYRGVTFNRRTGRWESNIWDTGKQVYLEPMIKLPLNSVALTLISTSISVITRRI